ncbi:winged helix-turn-helix domain-containing tetratricopeptide repeat protein [Taklimakanibacter deserti]|uniref:winged helix-turn-helix domain-containing tetratricopeptide repeat protein n=1 Tax=Taklimakanibacter deserti TaxID=2267839 RepID=UPI0013C420D2
MDVRFGPYRLRRRERCLDGPDGRLDISGRSFELLDALLRHPDEPVSKAELFDAVWPGLAVEENTLQAHISNLRKTLGSSMIVTVHGRGYKYTGPQPTAVEDDGAAPRTPLPSPARSAADRPPAIAVLPFANLSGDPGQQYFSDGVTEDIIDRLSRYRILSVIGRHSSFALRGSDDNYRDLRDKLAADFVVTGNVRKAENRIRVAARLTDVATERVIWADHYDRPLADVFALQDEVASIIASTLLGRVELEVAQKSTPAEPRRLTSYEHVLKGIWHFKKLTPQSNATAAEHFTKAVAEFPENAEAYRGLAICENNRWFFDFDHDGLVNGLKFAERGIELDATNAMCQCVRGFCQMYLGDLAAAVESYHKAASLNPGDPHIHVEGALLHVYLGRLTVGRDYFAQAFKLNPLPPLWYGEFVGVLHFVERSYEKALPSFLAVPEGAWDCMYALACLVQLGDLAQARALIQRYSHRQWDFLKGAAAEPFVNPEPRQRLIAGLQKALDA